MAHRLVYHSTLGWRVIKKKKKRTRAPPVAQRVSELIHPGGNPGANLKSISHRCHPILVAFAWDLTEKTSICPWVASRVAGFRAHLLGVLSDPDPLPQPAPTSPCTPPSARPGASAAFRENLCWTYDVGP